MHKPMTEQSPYPDLDYDDESDGDCWNCGGEGRVNTCIDGCCIDQDDIYCPYCSTRCDVCNPKPRQPEAESPSCHGNEDVR
jgi:hypothetical protein